jgi:hypothetical protein
MDRLQAMPLLRRALVIALAAGVLAPGAAQAQPHAQPLVDAAPFGTHFKDRVFSSAETTAHAAASPQFQTYPTADGTLVNVAISDAYGGMLSQTVAQSYADFLDSLDHGSELAKLLLVLAPPADVVANCGGAEGTLACYDSRTSTMYVPGEETSSPTGVTTSYVIAHEYGHHIAANRSNAPFSALAFGPKYWASYELVCDRALSGRLAPGDENEFYTENPGEGWAETYAQLKYPDVEWRFTPLLKPDQGAFDAARRDVLTPWVDPVTKAFKGTLGPTGSNTRRFTLPIALDGALHVRLVGPHTSDYNLVITSDAGGRATTTRSGSRDHISYEAACREKDTERLTVAVKRIKGRGPFTVRVEYAG